MNTPLRVAVAGLGHGAGYLDLARQDSRTELVAVVDADAERLAPHREAGLATFPSVREMAAAGIADVACLALPTRFHCETSIACLEAGMHVLQEKPLCLTDDEAARIKAAVEATDRVFQVGYEVRSSPLHQSILERIARGDLGEITNVHYNQHNKAPHHETSWRDSRTEMGGKLFDCVPHYLDLEQQWAGAPVVRLVAFGHLHGKTGVCADVLPETAVIALEYANGVRGSFSFGEINGYYDDASFGIFGTTGRIMGNPWLPEGAGSYELRRHHGVEKGQVVFDGDLTSRGHLGWREQWENFFGAILDNGPNMCPVDDAIAIHRVMVAIDQSLATGRIIELSE